LPGVDINLGQVFQSRGKPAAAIAPPIPPGARR
jgi:hypothetical protein